MEREFAIIVDRMRRYGPPSIEMAFKTTATNPETAVSNFVGNGRYNPMLFHPISEGFWIYLEEDNILLSILEPARLPEK